MWSHHKNWRKAGSSHARQPGLLAPDTRQFAGRTAFAIILRPHPKVKAFIGNLQGRYPGWGASMCTRTRIPKPGLLSLRFTCTHRRSSRPRVVPSALATNGSGLVPDPASRVLRDRGTARTGCGVAQRTAAKPEEPITVTVRNTG